MNRITRVRFSLSRRRSARTRARSSAKSNAWVVPWPSTPYQTAMREAGFWRAQAVQLAADQQEEAQAELQRWDPAARPDAGASMRRFLTVDAGGYLKRALAALRSAAHLAITPAERVRAERCRQNWESGAIPAGWPA